MRLILIYILFASSLSFAAVETGLNFGYNRQYYGDNWQNKAVSRSYSGYLAWYLFKNTGLELNYTYNEDITTQNTSFTSGANTVALVWQETVLTRVYGIGLRQAFYGQQSRIRPILSLGYAKQFVESGTDTTYKLNGVTESYHEDAPKQRRDSVFASIGLQIYLYKTFSINGSIKTIFRAFEYDEAKYNLQYATGFSCLF